MNTIGENSEDLSIGFSKQEEKRLHKNFGELSNIAGNIFRLNKKNKSIYFTSCFRGEGKTTAAKNCAYGLSQNAHNKVLLIDGYKGSYPTLSQTLGLEQEPGFMDILFLNTKVEDTIKKTKYDRLDIIPFGTIKNKKLTLNNKNAIKESLKKVKASYDSIIVDGDSIFGSSEVEIISDCFDSISIVVECERTKWEVLQIVKNQIETSGGNLLGVVLNSRKYYIPKFLYGKI